MNWFRFHIYTYLKPTYLPNYLLLIKQQLNKYFFEKNMFLWLDINFMFIPTYITTNLVFYIIFLWLNFSQDEPLNKGLQFNWTNCLWQTFWTK
jgi:hypothetical protein